MTAAQSLVSPDGFTNAGDTLSETNRMRQLAIIERDPDFEPLGEELMLLGSALKDYPARSFNTVEIMVDDEAMRALGEAIDSHSISPAAGIALKSLLLQIRLAIRNGK